MADAIQSSCMQARFALGDAMAWQRTGLSFELGYKYNDMIVCPPSDAQSHVRACTCRQARPAHSLRVENRRLLL
eukprot:6172676-Pleurochrysis_carterae.AAC.1